MHFHVVLVNCYNLESYMWMMFVLLPCPCFVYFFSLSNITICIFTGDKLFRWFIIFALAGAIWATNSVHGLCYLLLDGCGFCKEECVGN